MRIIGLDVGEVRVGIAACDELEMTSGPVDTFVRCGSLKKDITGLMERLRSLEPEMLVVGLPLSLDGDLGPQAKRVQGFADALARAAKLPVEMWDESLSSVEAHERMVLLGYSRQKRRENVDKVAASIILQSFLDNRHLTK